MMAVFEWLFWISVFFVFYIYLGYPLAIWGLSSVRRRKVLKGPYEPSVTIIIAAYNEAEHIASTIENKLALHYPRDKIEIIVVSDGSDDGTDEVVKSFAPHGVQLIRQEPRAGKTAALNLAVPAARGDVLVFSDANSMYDARALRRLVRNFYDADVGYVTGKMVYVDSDGTPIGDGCSAYMKYENFLREMETRIGSIVGVDGGIDAVRKSLYRPMKPDQLPDFVLPLKVVEQGFRVVYEPTSLLTENSLKTSHDEYRMRVRVALRALWALLDMRQLLSFNEYRFFAWQLWSHKLLRYLGFVFLLVAWCINLLLCAESTFYTSFFFIQTSIYLLTILPLHLSNSSYLHRIVAIIRYFCILNLATAHAFLKLCAGHKQAIWTPRKG